MGTAPEGATAEQLRSLTNRFPAAELCETGYTEAALRPFDVEDHPLYRGGDNRLSITAAAVLAKERIVPVEETINQPLSILTGPDLMGAVDANQRYWEDQKRIDRERFIAASEGLNDPSKEADPLVLQPWKPEDLITHEPRKRGIVETATTLATRMGNQDLPKDRLDLMIVNEPPIKIPIELDLPELPELTPAEVFRRLNEIYFWQFYRTADYMEDSHRINIQSDLEFLFGKEVTNDQRAAAARRLGNDLPQFIDEMRFGIELAQDASGKRHEEYTPTNIGTKARTPLELRMNPGAPFWNDLHASCTTDEERIVVEKMRKGNYSDIYEMISHLLDNPDPRYSNLSRNLESLIYQYNRKGLPEPVMFAEALRLFPKLEAMQAQVDELGKKLNLSLMPAQPILSQGKLGPITKASEKPAADVIKTQSDEELREEAGDKLRYNYETIFHSGQFDGEEYSGKGEDGAIAGKSLDGTPYSLAVDAMGGYSHGKEVRNVLVTSIGRRLSQMNVNPSGYRSLESFLSAVREQMAEIIVTGITELNNIRFDVGITDQTDTPGATIAIAKVVEYQGKSYLIPYVRGDASVIVYDEPTETITEVYTEELPQTERNILPTLKHLNWWLENIRPLTPGGIFYGMQTDIATELEHFWSPMDVEDNTTIGIVTDGTTDTLSTPMFEDINYYGKTLNTPFGSLAKIIKEGIKAGIKFLPHLIHRKVRELQGTINPETGLPVNYCSIINFDTGDSTSPEELMENQDSISIPGKRDDIGQVWIRITKKKE